MGHSRPGRCDSVASTTACRPLSPARHTSHLTPRHIETRHLGLGVSCFYLKDFILQHWQLVGIPRHKVVANFGIFTGDGHFIVRPVKTSGISSQLVYAHERDRKEGEGLDDLPIWWVGGMSSIKLKMDNVTRAAGQYHKLYTCTGSG